MQAKYTLHDHLLEADPAPEPGTLGRLLADLPCPYDHVGFISYANLGEIRIVSRAQTHLLTATLEIIDPRAEESPERTVALDFYWSPRSGHVLCPSFPVEVHPAPILFSSYDEFVWWASWRIRSLFQITERELEALRLQLTSLTVKVTSPLRQVEAMGPSNRPMLTTDLELA
jgi:hypothetical protein